MIFSTQSLEELKQYIQYEYEATDAEEVCIMSTEELLQSYRYDLSLYTRYKNSESIY